MAKKVSNIKGSWDTSFTRKENARVNAMSPDDLMKELGNMFSKLARRLRSPERERRHAYASPKRRSFVY